MSRVVKEVSVVTHAEESTPPRGPREHAALECDEEKRRATVLICSVFIISICAIVYELLISTLSSYLLGSSVLHFSIVIGLFMFFMGVGSYLSKSLTSNLLDHFVRIEILIGCIGGLSAILLQATYSLSEYYYLALVCIVAGISICAGLEIPLVTRIVERQFSLKDALANILAFDYLGALLASFIFPLLLLPYFGVIDTALIIGLLNIGVASFNLYVFRSVIVRFKQLVLLASVCGLLLIVTLAYSLSLTTFLERQIYQDPIIHSEQTAYQRIILTKFKEDVRLFLDGNIQFSSIDEHRYHEALIHVPLANVNDRSNILLLGGGDGLGVREALKYPDISRVTVVDIDPRITTLAKTHPDLLRLNKNALEDPRVRVVNEDAFSFVRNTAELYSAIIIDLPDPNNLSIGKLYTKEFYELVKKRLAVDGIVVTQSSSPFFAREAFWSINTTLRDVFTQVYPYTVYVPSFGPWGFNLASNIRRDFTATELPENLQYVNKHVLGSLFTIEPDISEVPTRINKLNNQVLVEYYERSWDEWQ